MIIIFLVFDHCYMILLRVYEYFLFQYLVSPNNHGYIQTQGVIQGGD